MNFHCDSICTMLFLSSLAVVFMHFFRVFGFIFDDFFYRFRKQRTIVSAVFHFSRIVSRVSEWVSVFLSFSLFLVLRKWNWTTVYLRFVGKTFTFVKPHKWFYKPNGKSNFLISSLFGHRFNQELSFIFRIKVFFIVTLKWKFVYSKIH